MCEQERTPLYKVLSGKGTFKKNGEKIMIESIYLLEVCLLLLILSVALLCWQIGRLLESLDNVYRQEEMLYRIRTGGMIDLNRQIKPKRRDRL